MKHSFFTRFVALVLTLVLVAPLAISAVPEASAAGYIKGKFLSKEYTRKKSSGDIFQFDKVLKDSYGFTLYFTLDEVTEGKLDFDKHVFEVCVKDTSGEWIVAELFHLNKNDIGEEVEVNVSLGEPRDITQMAILIRSEKKISFTYSILLEDKCYGYGGMRIEGERAEKQYKRSNRHTYPFILDAILYDCTGFTLHYDLVEVMEGIFDYKTKYEVCVKDTSDKWTCVSTFKLRDDYAPIDISWDKAIDVAQIAVLPVISEKHEFNHYFAISDAVYEDDEEEKSAAVSYGGYLSGYWSDTKFKRSGRSSTPFVFDSPLKKCKGFTLDYEVHDVTDGNMKNDCKFQIFYRTSDGTWNKSKEFTVEDGFASVDVKLKKAATVTQVAVHCMNAGYFSFQYSMGVRNPIY